MAVVVSIAQVPRPELVRSRLATRHDVLREIRTSDQFANRCGQFVDSLDSWSDEETELLSKVTLGSREHLSLLRKLLPVRASSLLEMARQEEREERAEQARAERAERAEQARKEEAARKEEEAACKAVEAARKAEEASRAERAWTEEQARKEEASRLAAKKKREAERIKADEEKCQAALEYAARKEEAALQREMAMLRFRKSNRNFYAVIFTLLSVTALVIALVNS